MKRTAAGFTLTELMITVAILAIIAAIAVPSYHYFLKRGRLEEARATLAENVYFMEQYYARHHRFKATSTTWPTLPDPATKHFDITFTSAAKNEADDHYRLRASPNAAYAASENRWLEIDHHGNVKLCRKVDGKDRCEKY